MVVNKNVLHNTVIYDDKMNPIHTMTWYKEGKTPRIVSFKAVSEDTNKGKNEPTAEATNTDQGIDVVMHDGSPSNEKSASKEEPEAQPVINNPPQ